MASLSSVAVRKPSVVRSLPGRLPLLLIGSGLANASLARTLSVHGYSDEDQHFRMFDQHSAHHQTSYALNVQSWATDGLDHLVRRGRPKHGDQPGFVHSATVDAQHGGKGGVRPQLLSITTNQAVADLQGVSEGTNVAATQARVKSGVFLRSVKANVPVQYNKKFVDFEHLVDENGREAVKAWFEDGSSAIGSAIIGGDGVRSKVRSRLLPSIQPKVLPVVCYTGQWDFEASRAIINKLEDDMVPAYHTRPTADTETYTIFVGDKVAFAVTYQYLDNPSARMQYIYARMAKGYELDAQSGEWVKTKQANVDPLFNPDRTLDQATDIPLVLFDEINALKNETSNDAVRLYLDSVDAKTNIKQYNWLMRTVKLPTDKAELDNLKSQLPGGDKVFLIGDAAHAAPIFQGQSGSHSILDGFDLGSALAASFRIQSQPSHVQPASGPSSSLLLDTLNAFESNRLEDWADSVDVAEGQLYDLFQSQAQWDADAKALAQIAGTGANAIDPAVRAKQEPLLESLQAWVVEKTERERSDEREKTAARKAEWVETAEARRVTERKAEVMKTKEELEIRVEDAEDGSEEQKVAKRELEQLEKQLRAERRVENEAKERARRGELVV